MFYGRIFLINDQGSLDISKVNNKDAKTTSMTPVIRQQLSHSVVVFTLFP